MIDFDKFYRLKAQFEEMADMRRMRSERYRAKLSESRELRELAVLAAHPQFQAMPLSALLALPPDELRDTGVDEKTLMRAGIERRRADELLNAGRDEQITFENLATLFRSLCTYLGEPQP